MTTLQNTRPSNYAASSNILSKYVVRLILPLIIDSDNVYVDYEDIQHDSKWKEHPIVLAPPSLLNLLKVFISPAFQTGETYRVGHWYLKKGSLHEFMEELYLNQERFFFKYYNFVNQFKGITFFLQQKIFTRYFTRRVKQHYEVDSDLYASFLDEEMVYTCAFFDTLEDDLLTAQIRKLDKVISRMKLPKSNAKVLEIGCGWGSLARRIVSTHSQVQYTGLTIAKEQIRRASELDQALETNQRERIGYKLEDYLDHHTDDGYDGIAVIGMMEHVGLSHHTRFFKKLCSLLKSGKRAVVHTILAGGSGEPTNSWIDHYIFQGGYAPSLAEIASAVEGCKCNIEDVFIHDPQNYKLTLECWQQNFLNGWEGYRKKNLSDWDDDRADELFRIWHFYLSAVRNMFIPGAMNFKVIHVVIKKP